MSSSSTQIKEHFDTKTKAIAYFNQKLWVFENWQVDISELKYIKLWPTKSWVLLTIQL